MMMVPLLPDRGRKTLGSQDQGFRAVRQESCWAGGGGKGRKGCIISLVFIELGTVQVIWISCPVRTIGIRLSVGGQLIQSVSISHLASISSHSVSFYHFKIVSIQTLQTSISYKNHRFQLANFVQKIGNTFKALAIC